jgi:hypothetical protein
VGRRPPRPRTGPNEGGGLRDVRSAAALSCAFKRGDTLADNAQGREVRTDRIGNIRPGEMGVMLLCHAGVGMAKLFRNDAQRNPTHGQGRTVRVAEHVERYGRLDLRTLASVRNRPELLRLTPRAPIVTDKMGSSPSFPAVRVQKGVWPSSVKTTWRGLPASICES